ncbi:hypothetical protein PR048_001484 [Dryococelus australis]|uniref:Mutator-like transposase domain-containing protein n=1 Tax=Dryococelus australis TaxID=614101 RepID=A0ABQ9IHL4_9NEOP|nr:hypothetical protein PR048_001484 [Dryococelus australis]
MDSNSAAVCGALSVGGGPSQLEAITASLNTPCMSSRTYSKYHDTMSSGLLTTSLEEMETAAEEEVKLALEDCEIDADGLPLITVVANGSCSKRSYRANFSSLSGVVRKFA